MKIKPRTKDEGIESFATETAEFINEVTEKIKYLVIQTDRGKFPFQYYFHASENKGKILFVR